MGIHLGARYAYYYSSGGSEPIEVPTTQATDIIISNVEATSFDISFTEGDGANRIVVVKQGEVDSTPVDGTSYTANSVFTQGDEIGTGNFVVYRGSGNNVTVTGLTPETEYHVRVFEFNGAGNGIKYFTDTATGNPASETTIAATPTLQSADIIFSNVTDVSFDITFTIGNGQKRLVVIKSGSAVDSLPTDTTTYTANTNFGDGTELGTGNFVVLAGTGNTVSVTGLTAETEYHVRVFEFNGQSGDERYLTDTYSGNPASQETSESGAAEVMSDILFTNVTSPTHHVARSGVTHQGIITPPTGYTVTAWEIWEHTHDRNMVDSGTGDDVSTVFTFTSMEACNIYDLVVEVSDGDNTFRRRFFGEFFCLPVAPTVFDATWSTANAKDGSWTDRPGYRIRVTGNMTGSLNAYHWQSSDPTNPIHIVLDNATINNSANQCMKLTAFKNVILDGATDEDVSYGLNLTKGSGGTGILFEFQACEPNNATRVSENVYVVGVHGNGGSNPSTGVTGFRAVTTQVVEATNKEGTYEMVNLVFARCRCENTFEEGWYLGHSNHNLSGGNAFSGFRDCYIFNIEAENIGNDAFQIGQFTGSEVFNFYLANWGQRNQQSHRNGIQLGDGSDGLAVYAGIADGGHNGVLIANGRVGNNYELFSTVITSTGRDEDGSGTNVFTNLNNGDPLTIYKGLTHNTWVFGSGPIFTMFHTTGVTYDKFYCTGNLWVSNTTTETEIGGGGAFAAGELEFDNKITNNISTFQFENAANKNYKPSSTSTPAWDSFTTFSLNSPWAAYDVEGYEYVVTSPIYGAYSGVTKLIAATQPTVVYSITAVTDPDPISVANGTAWPPATLPEQVTVTLSNATTRDIDVSWAQGSYDGDVADTYTLTGSLINLPADVSNPSTLTASIDVTVEEAAAPFIRRIDIAGATNETNWYKTGSNEPYPGTDTNRTFDLTDGSGVTDTEIQVIAVNTDAVNRWNQRLTQTQSWSGSPAVPNSVMGAIWNTGSQGGSQRVGILRIVNRTGGTNPLSTGTFNVKVIASRTGTGVRNNDISVNSGTPVTVDVLGNTNVVAEFTGVVPASGIITVSTTYNPTGSDGSINAYINAIIIERE